jgi:hypothetical protein
MLDNNKTYAEIIVDMMNDYNITMFDALLWDFESYPFVGFSAEKLYTRSGIEALELTFRDYLVLNGITDQKDKDFYTDIFMGRKNNMELRRAETQ